MPKSYEDKVSESSAGGGTSVGASVEGEEASAASASNLVESDPSGGDDLESSKHTVIISDMDISVRASDSMEVKMPLDSIKLAKSVLTRDNNILLSIKIIK